MAKAEVTEGNVTELPKRTRRPSEGPRKVKPIHAAVHVEDENGVHIPNAKVTVHKASKDFETIYGHMEQNAGLSRVRIPLDSLTD